MTQRLITIQRTIEDDGDDNRPPIYCEVEAKLFVTYTPGDPGRWATRMEDSYPPEPADVEWEVKAVRLLDDTPTDLDERKAIEGQAGKYLETLEDLHEELIEQFEDDDD